MISHHWHVIDRLSQSKADSYVASLSEAIYCLGNLLSLVHGPTEVLCRLIDAFGLYSVPDNCWNSKARPFFPAYVLLSIGLIANQFGLLANWLVC